jgi:hypothetical protein
MIKSVAPFLLIGIFFSGNVTADTLSNLSLSLDSDPHVLVVKQEGIPEKKCHFREKLDEPVLSGDGKAIIVASNKYVLLSDVQGCDEKQISMFSTPASAGELKDVNIDAKIYLALDFVSTQPFTYLATVAHFGSEKNIIGLPGAYISGVPVNRLQKNSFSYTLQPRISRDGRYVSSDGEINCKADSYPGVWDLKTKKRLVIQSAGSDLSDRERDEEISLKCKKLFQ